jgi:hypothetical protein
LNKAELEKDQTDSSTASVHAFAIAFIKVSLVSCSSLLASRIIIGGLCFPFEYEFEFNPASASQSPKHITL